MLAESPITVFIPSGAGAPGFSGISRCLREESSWKIIAGDANEHAYGKSLCDVFVVAPSSSDEAIYVEFVLSVCEAHSVDVVLPITTRELEVLAANVEKFHAIGVKVVVSNIKAIAIANDKGKAANAAKELGLPVPEFRVCGDFKEMAEAVEFLQKNHAWVCFKPVKGNGSRGFGIVVKDIYNGAFLSRKAGVEPMTWEEWSKRLPMVFDTPMMVCAYLGGSEYSVDLLCVEGKTLFCIPRTRDKMIGGISVAGSLERSFGLIAFCIRLAQALELDGPIGMQWKEDESGVPHLIEINPRLQGTTSALALAGINLPVQAVRQALDLPLTATTADIQWGKRFVRFWDERMLD
jgi:carbamoyl-phosphate synthase large subunit